MLECLRHRLGPTWNSFLRVYVPLLLALLGVFLVEALYTGDWALFQAKAYAILGVAAVLLLSMIIGDIIVCAAEQGGSPPTAAPTAGGSPTTGNVDCASAQAALADAQARAASAAADLDSKAAKVRTLQDLVDKAHTALTFALAALAASAFYPWLLPVTITLAATAGLVLYGAAKALGAAVADMNAAAMALGAAQDAVKKAESVVAQACAVVVTPAPPHPGITLNALNVLAGVHANHRSRSAI